MELRGVVLWCMLLHYISLFLISNSSEEARIIKKIIIINIFEEKNEKNRV